MYCAVRLLLNVWPTSPDSTQLYGHCGAPGAGGVRNESGRALPAALVALAGVLYVTAPPDSCTVAEMLYW